MASPLYTMTLGRFLGDLRVVSFRGHEGMNRLYRFDVRATVTAGEVSGFASQALEMPATFTMHFASDAWRTVHGMITSAEAIGRTSVGEQVVSLRIEPRMAWLKKRRTSRIFQDRTAREIVDDVLAQRNLLRRWRLARDLPKRTYAVQYDETDYAFVTRILAEEGIFYSFDQPRELGGDEAMTGMGQTEVVVFSDTAESYAPIDGAAELAYRASNEGAGLEQSEHHLQAFSVRHAMRSKAVLLRGFDHNKPPLPPRDASTIDGIPKLERATAMHTLVSQGMTIYEPQHSREEALVNPVPAQNHLESARADARLAEGRSACRRLVPGRKFRLVDHDSPDLDGEYVVVSCEHTGYAPEAAPRGVAIYENEFACAPGEVPQRPRRPRNRPRQTLETAIVVGPVGQEIHTDELGRVKVQFHWDLDGEMNERASCWLRVSQAWAGAGFGAQFIPRVGMEVLVGFIAGDPDRPVVTGCLYNGLQSPAFPLPREKTQSGLRTRSSPGGTGFNELLFDDKAGEEHVSLRSERTMMLNACDDLHIHSGANVLKSTAGRETHEVGGDFNVDTKGSHKTHIDGASSHHTGGVSVVSVGDLRRTSVAGGDELRIQGDARTVVLGDQHTAVGGARGPDRAASLAVNGFYQLGASKEILLTSPRKIVFSVGRTSLTMTPDGVIIDTPSFIVERAKVQFRHSDKAGYTFDEALTIKAPTVGLFSSGASLVLDADAKLDGALVKLNCGGAAASVTAGSSSDEPATATFQLQDFHLLQDGTPISLVISLPTGEAIERVVDASGKVVLQGLKGDRFTLIDIRRDGQSIAGRVVV